MPAFMPPTGTTAAISSRDLSRMAPMATACLLLDRMREHCDDQAQRLASHGMLQRAIGGRAREVDRHELAEECDINVLMAYGRCLRPALYSSLRSSPSHPTGVSALRVTIAIANARFARKQW